MSLIPSLLLFLLCLSSHACNARHLGAIGKEPHTKSLLPNKNDENSSSPGEGGNGEGLENQISRVEKEDDQHKPLMSSLKSKKMKKGQKGVKISPGAAVKTESHHQVSWHLPHNKKRIEEQPGWFMLDDYAKPQTHPPAHN